MKPFESVIDISLRILGITKNIYTNNENNLLISIKEFRTDMDNPGINELVKERKIVYEYYE